MDPWGVCLLYITSTGDWVLSTHTYSNEHKVLARAQSISNEHKVLAMSTEY